MPFFETVANPYLTGVVETVVTTSLPLPVTGVLAYFFLKQGKHIENVMSVQTPRPIHIESFRSFTVSEFSFFIHFIHLF